MYKCKHCGKEFESKTKLGGHTVRCEKNPNSAKNKKAIAESHKHLNTSSLKYKQYNDTENTYKCCYCGKECCGQNSLKQHEIRCKENPNKLVYFIPGFNNKGRTPWNKGLTSDDERVKKGAETYHNRYEQGLIKVWCDGLTKDTDERIAKYVKKMKANPDCGGYREKSGYGKSGTYKGIFCNSTWELAYLLYCIDNNYKIERCNKYYIYTGADNEEHKYYPDFIVNDEIIEIKGYITESWKMKLPIVEREHIKVLYKEDMKPILEYVTNTYGEDFYKLYD